MFERPRYDDNCSSERCRKLQLLALVLQTEYSCLVLSESLSEWSRMATMMICISVLSTAVSEVPDLIHAKM